MSWIIFPLTSFLTFLWQMLKVWPQLVALHRYTHPLRRQKGVQLKSIFLPHPREKKTHSFVPIYWFNNNLQPTTWSSSTWKGLFFGQIRLCWEARNKSITFKAYRKSIRFHSVHLRGSQENSKHFHSALVKTVLWI